MRILEATQEKRIRSRALVTVKIAKLVQFSDYEARTVGATWYFSDRAVRYPFGGGPVIQAEAFLRGVDPVQSSMADVPSPESRYANSLIATTRLVLANAPYRGGLYLAEVLEAYPLEGAEIEVIEVAVNPASGRIGRFDLTALSGTSHTPWFRGRVARVEGTDEIAIQLRCESVLPQLRWRYVTDAATADPRDLGARFPLPVGGAKSVKAVGAVVGWSTTLVRPLAASAPAGTLIELTDVTGLPSSGTIRIDAEELTYDTLETASRTVRIASRGASGTIAVDHAPGAYVVEQIAESVYVLSQRPLSGVSAVYLRNPYNGEKTLVPDLLTAVVLQDTALVPGETISTLRVPVGTMRVVLTDAHRAARVTQQPEFTDTGTAATTDGPPSAASSGTVSLEPLVGTYYRGISGGADSPRWTRVANDPYEQNLTRTLTFAAGSLPNVNAISVQFLATVQWDTTGSSAGTYAIYVHPNNFPGFGEPVLGPYAIPANSADSAPWASNPRGIAYNPSEIGARSIYVRPYVAGAVAFAAGKYVGLSNVRMRFGYVDASNIVRYQDVAIEAASTGFGLDLFFDAEGEVVPVPLAPGFSFDSVSGVSVSGCTASADAVVKSEGAASWKLEATESVVEDFESASGWSTLGGCNVALEGTLKTEGSSSLEVENLSTWTPNTQPRGIWKHTVGPFDLSGKLIAFDLYVPSNANVAGGFGYEYLAQYGFTPTTGFRLILTSTAGTTWTVHSIWWFGRNHILPDQWNTLVFDPSTFPPASTAGGGVDLSNVQGFEIDFVPTATVALQFYVDRFRTLPKTMAAQVNATAGTVDLEADGDTYRLALRASAATDFQEGEVYFENTAGSGTTPPAARRTLPFAPVDVGVGAFAEASPVAADVGSPAFDDVETVGVVVTLPASPPGAVIDLPTIWVDDLRVRDDATNRYAGTPGTVISRRADVLRYLIEDLGGDAGGCDDAFFDATDTSLGGGATGFGVDLRELGEMLPEIAVKLAYEARSNLIRVETASGSKWRTLTADADYEYGAPVRVLTEFKSGGGVVFEGQDTATLRARTFAYYGFDAALGDPSTGGYQGLVGATPEASDVAKPTAVQLAAAEASYGQKAAEYLFLRATVDEATALDLLGFYAWCRRRPRRVAIVTGLSWREAYDLELGDVVSVQPRWRSTAVTGRVIEYVKDFRTQVVNLRLAEVPT